MLEFSTIQTIQINFTYLYLGEKRKHLRNREKDD